MMAIDAKFLQHIESFPRRRDIESHNDEKLQQSRHLERQIRTRRGFDRRPYKPLQYDVRSPLYGR